MNAHDCVTRGIVECDALRTIGGVYHKDKDVRDLAMESWWWLCRSGVRAAVLLVGPPGAGKSTWLAAHQERGVAYYDATLTKYKTRAQLMKIAHEQGLHVTFVVFDTPLEECLRRNALRDVNRKAPPSIVSKMWNEIQREPPQPGPGVTVVHV